MRSYTNEISIAELIAGVYGHIFRLSRVHYASVVTWSVKVS